MKKKKSQTISESTLKRLADYLCVLRYLDDQGMETVSSSVLSSMMNITDSQIRKDLSYFGSFGKKGVGYNVKAFIEAIEKIMNLNEKHNVCIVGVGRLGSALLNYKRIKETPFNIVAAFDNDKKKIGKKIGNITVHNIESIDEVCGNIKCEIAVLTVPSYVVHDVYARIVKAPIASLLNFTPIILTGNDDLLVRNMDFVSELKIISYLLKEKDNADKGKG